MATPSAPELVSCPSHPGREILFVCSTCGEAFACSRCVTSIHRGHVLNGVDETAKSLSAQVSELLRFRTTDAETVARRLDDIQIDYDQTTDNLKNVIVEVKQKREKMKELVDEMADKAILRIHDLLHDNEDILTNYKTKLYELGNHLHLLTKDKTESVFPFGKALDIICLFKDLKNPPLFPRCPSFRWAKFISSELDMEGLGKMFGKFAENQTKAKQSDQSPPPIPPRTKPKSESLAPVIAQQTEVIPSRKNKSVRRVSTNSARTENPKQHSPRLTKSERRSASTSDESPPSLPNKVLLDIKKLANIQEESTSKIRCFCYNEGTFVISYYAGRRLVFVNENGVKHRKIKVMSNIMGTCISPLTGNVWICCEDYSVIEIGPKMKTERFKTESLPMCICISRSNMVFIGMENELVRCSNDGNVLLRAKCLDETTAFPRVIRENPNTGEIAVSHGYELETSSKITVFDRELKSIYHFPSDKLPQGSFIPENFCFTPNGELLALNSASNTLVWVGRRGLALRETPLHPYCPSMMTIGPNNQLYLVHQTLASQILTSGLLRTDSNEYSYATF